MESKHFEIYSGGRRQFLVASGAALGSLLIPGSHENSVLAEQKKTRKLLPILMVYLHGGASQKEMLDPDPPHAPAEFRGEIESIQTSVEGMRFSALRPKTAQFAHRMSIVRNFETDSNDHAISATNVLRGNHPHGIGYSWQRHSEAPGQLPYSLVFSPNSRGHFLRDALDAGDALTFEWGDSKHLESAFKELSPPEKERLRARLSLLNLDHDPHAKAIRSHVLNVRLAVALSLGSAGVSDALHPLARREQCSDQERLTASIADFERKLELYGGNNSTAEAFLVADELIERGASSVTINHTVRSLSGNLDNWDDHSSIAKNMSLRVPEYDAAFAGALSRMDRYETAPKLLVELSEFERTPKINPGGGRDHWTTGTLAMAAPEGHGIIGGSTSGKRNYKGMITSDAFHAKDGAVFNTILHAAANGSHDEFLEPNHPRVREIMLHK